MGKGTLSTGPIVAETREEVGVNRWCHTLLTVIVHFSLSKLLRAITDYVIQYGHRTQSVYAK